MRLFLLLSLLACAANSATCQEAPARRSSAQPTPGVTIFAESGSRLALLTRDSMRNAAIRRIYDELIFDAQTGRETGLAPGTIATAAYSPETAVALKNILDYLASESTLGSELFELLSLITAREMSIAWEWSVHEDAARQAGLDARVIDVVRNNSPLTGIAREHTLVIDFGRQLFRQRSVASQTFRETVDLLGRQGTYDAIVVLCIQAMAGIMHRALDQQPPAGWNSSALPPLAEVGTPIGRPGEFVELGARPPLAADVFEDSLYRFPLLNRTELDARAIEIFERMVGTDSDFVPRGPVGMTFNSPALVDPVQQINTALRRNGVLETRLSEIVITATGREMNSQYQWLVHGAAARRAGAEPEVLDTIRNDENLDALNERDAIAIAFTRELFREQTVSPATFARAVEIFGERGVVEIAALVGDYLFVTTMYNALGMRLRPDQQPDLPHRAGAPIGAEWR